MNINPKEKVWYYACFSILFVQYIVFFLIHFLARGLQPDSQLRLNASRFFKTFSLQFFGSFPSTHFANQDVFQTRYLSRLTLIIFLVLASSSIILIFFSYSPPKTKARNGIRSSQSETQLTTDLLVIGISLFIIPTCVTAMTLRFQDEVQIGLPYSSFYYEQVGFTVLFFLFIRKVTGKRKNFLVLVISITIIYSSCWISLVVNNTVTSADFPLTQNLAISQNILGWQREAVERAAKYGALNSLGKSAEIDFVPQYSWTTTEYLSFFAGRKIRVLNSPHWWQNTNIIPKGQCTNPECSQMYYANVVATSYDSGIIALSKFSDILLRDGLMESQKWELIISTKTFVDEVSICEVVNSAKMNEAPVNHRFVIFTGKLPHSGVLTVPYRSQKPILSTSFSIC